MPPEQQAGVQELSVSKEGVTIKSFQMNTLLTFVAVLFSGAAAGVGYLHMNDAKDGNVAFIGALKEQTSAIKDQTQVAREQNCLMRFDQKERQERAEFCRSVTR